MNIGAIPKAAHVTNSTPQNDPMGLVKSLAVVYNDYQIKKEENAKANQENSNHVKKQNISAQDLKKAEAQDKNRVILEDKNSRINEDKEIGE